MVLAVTFHDSFLHRLILDLLILKYAYYQWFNFGMCSVNNLHTCIISTANTTFKYV